MGPDLVVVVQVRARAVEVDVTVRVVTRVLDDNTVDVVLNVEVATFVTVEVTKAVDVV